MAPALSKNNARAISRLWLAELGHTLFSTCGKPLLRNPRDWLSITRYTTRWDTLTMPTGKERCMVFKNDIYSNFGQKCIWLFFLFFVHQKYPIAIKFPINISFAFNVLRVQIMQSKCLPLTHFHLTKSGLQGQFRHPALCHFK